MTDNKQRERFWPSGISKMATATFREPQNMVRVRVLASKSPDVAKVLKRYEDNFDAGRSPWGCD